jgi:hypothetical protein
LAMWDICESDAKKVQTDHHPLRKSYRNGGDH